MCTHRGGLSAGAGAGGGAGAAQAAAPAARQRGQTAQQQGTNAVQAASSANWINYTGRGNLDVPGVGRAVALEVSNPVLGDRVSVDIYDQNGALARTRYFSGNLMSSRARAWARGELIRMARQQG